MKAIILAAGYATRLYPLTKDKPKPLLEIRGKPIIEYILDRINQINEIDEIFIVTNNKFFKNFLAWKTNYKSKINVIIVNDKTSSNEDRLGSLGDICYVIKNMRIHEDVMIVAGDNIFEFHLADLMQLYKHKKCPVVALYDVEDIELAKHYGIVSVDNNGLMIHFEEKPLKPRSTLSSTGIYIYPRYIIELLFDFVMQYGKKDKAGDFLEWLHTKENIYCYVTQERWFDIGTLDQLRQAEKEFRG